MANLVWQFEGRLVVAVHGASDPSNLEWKGYLRDTLVQPKPSMLRVLIVSHGGGPSGTQRMELTDTLSQSAPTAYLSDRWLARSLVNTLAWFNPQLRAFGLHQDTDAFDFLELTQVERKTAQSIRTALEKQLQIGANGAAAARSDSHLRQA